MKERKERGRRRREGGRRKERREEGGKSEGGAGDQVEGGKRRLYIMFSTVTGRPVVAKTPDVVDKASFLIW